MRRFGARLAAMTALAAACSREYASDGIPPSANDAGPDGGDWVDTGAPDVTTRAAPTFCLDSHFICLDFDEGQLVQDPLELETTFDGSVELTGGTALSQPTAMLSKLAPGVATGNDARARIRRRFLGALQRVACEFDVRIEQWDPMTVASLVSFDVDSDPTTPYQKTIFWVVFPSLSMALMQLVVFTDGGRQQTDIPAGQAVLHDWIHARIVIDITNAGSATLTLNGASFGSVSFSWHAVASGELGVGLGSGSGTTADGGVHTIYDNVVCDVAR